MKKQFIKTSKETILFFTCIVVVFGFYFIFSVFGGTTINRTIVSNPDLERGLVGHWTFDGKDMDLSSSTAEVLDRSGNGFHGDWIDHATTTTIGKIGQAIEFDGVNDGLNLSTVNDAIDATEGSFSFWIKRDFEDNTAGNHVALMLYTDDDNYIQFVYLSASDVWALSEFRNTTESFLTLSPSTVPKDTWTHVAATWSETGDVAKLYINGDFEDSYSSLGSWVGSLSFTFFSNYLGGAYWQGGADDVRIYDRVISANEVKRLYELGATTKINKTLTSNSELDNGLVGHWTFDGGDMDLSSSTAEVLDVSGSGNNGDWQNHSTTTTIGKIGQAIEFDGSDDYVNIGNQTEIDFERTDPQSYSFWAKWDDFSPPGGAQTFFGRISVNVGSHISWCKNSIGSYCNPNSIVFAIVNNGTFNGLIMSTESSSVSPGPWYHVIVTYDGSSSPSGVKIYVNGVSMSLTTQTSNLSATIKPNSSWRIGDDASNDWLRGEIDDVRVYNRALSAGEVKRLYELGATTKVNTTITTNDSLESGLVAYYSFDGPATMQLKSNDQSDSGNTAFLSTEELQVSFESTEDLSYLTENATLATSADAIHRDVSVKITATTTDGFSGHNPTGTWDFSEHNEFVFWAKSDTGSEITNGQLYLFSSSDLSDFYVWNGLRYGTEWGPVRVDLVNPDSSSGAPTLSSIDWFRFDVNTSGDSALFDYATVIQSDGNTSPGVLGQGYRFAGATSSDFFVATSTDGSINNLADGDFAVAAWVKLDAHTSNSGDPHWRSRIVRKRSTTYNPNRGWLFRINDDKSLYFATVDSAGVDTAYESTESLSVGEWAHVAVVHTNSSHSAKLYINGEETAYQTTTVGNGSNYDDSSGSLYIAQALGGGDRLLRGSLDDLRIYNRTLSADEIMRLYTMGR